MTVLYPELKNQWTTKKSTRKIKIKIVGYLSTAQVRARNSKCREKHKEKTLYMGLADILPIFPILWFGRLCVTYRIYKKVKDTDEAKKKKK